MNPIVYAIPIFMLTILIEVAVAQWKKKPVYNIPDAITSLHFGVLSQVSGAFTKVLTFGIYVLIYERYHAVELPSNSVWVLVLAVILYDFFYYWAHRLGHEVNVLWAAHQVHHSSEYYNLSTALRQSSTGSLFGWIFYLPMAVLGVPPLVMAIAGLIDLLYQYWVHTELVPKLGWFDRVFVSPSNHRVHHGQNDYCIDKNYGGILIVWDRLFGTFVEERDNEKIAYGIRKPLESFNPVWGNLNIYTHLWRLSKKAKTWSRAISVWFMPPGGWNTPLDHLDTSRCIRYDTHTGKSVQGYAVCHYALMVAYATHFIAIADQLPLLDRSLYAGLIIFAAVSLGVLLEGRRWSRMLESMRVLSFASIFVIAPTWFGFDSPFALKLTVIVMALISLWCLLRFAYANNPKQQSVTP